jgi:phosphate-selective porin OprO and OprP
MSDTDKNDTSLARVVTVILGVAFLSCMRGDAEDSLSPYVPIPVDPSTTSTKKSSRLSFLPSWSEGLAWQTADELLQLRVGAYVLFDWGGVSQDSRLDSIASPVGTRADVRDFQIQVSGRLYKKTMFRLQFNIDDLKAELQDNYLQREGIPYVGNVRLGHFKGSFGLENSTSIRHLVFMERSLADTLTTGRGVGISLDNTVCDERLTYQMGAFWDTNSAEKISQSQGYTLRGEAPG